MTPEQYERVRELFLAARETPPEQRSGFLTRACAGDDSLRTEVESLLANDALADTFLQTPALGPSFAVHGPESVAAPADGLGSHECLADEATGMPRSTAHPPQIGQYRILETIGQGGMGVVYRAEQTNPRRTVALKVIRPGLQSQDLLRRFTHEGHVLGLLQHPGIAQVYEAGAADTGCGTQPFFAMELIRGRPLGQYAEGDRLDVRRRLELLAKICDAVQHAHQKGVIHRDLKPANILVDDQGQPKVLDFGVARATDADVRVTAPETMPGQLIGTLTYMSPEQISGDPSELDTRSDVYSLGVICYELLAGRPPLDLSTKTIPEAARAIVEQDPPPLGTLNRALRGDLDTIVAKALEKDKSRRYQSASELAEDIRRYLTDQPILARPATTVYQLRKFAKRNKPLVAGLLVTFFTLVVGIVGTSTQAVRATRARNDALGAERLAEQRRAEADQQRAAAATQANKAEAIRQFLEEMLASVDPAVARERDTTLLREILTSAARRVDNEFARQPEVQASLRTTIGRAYLTIGLYDEAEAHARGALKLWKEIVAEDHPRVAAALADLGSVLYEKGEIAAAADLLQASLDMYRRLSASDGPGAARALDMLAHVALRRGDLAGAESLLREARAVLQQLNDDDGLASNGEALGVMLAEQGRYAEAEAVFRENLARERALRPSPHPSIATALLNLGVAQRDQAKFDEAAVHLQDAVAMQRELRGRHTAVANALCQLGQLHEQRGAWDAAAAAYQEAIDIDRETLPPDHADLRQHLTSLGGILTHQREYDRAETLLREVLALEREHGLGPTRPRAGVLHKLGHVLRIKREYAEAEQLLREALEVRQGLFDGPHPDIAATLVEIGNARVGLGKYDEAEAPLVEALAMTRNAVGDEHPAVAARMNGLALLYYRRGMLDEAEELYRQSLAINRRLLGDRHAAVMVGINSLAGVIRERGDYNQAEAMYREALALSRDLLGEENTETATILSNLANVLHSQKRFPEAEEAYHEALTMERKLHGEDHPDTAITLTKIAGLMRATGRPQEGEPLLRQALATLQERLAPTHVFVQATLNELGRTLLALDRAEEAETHLRECLRLRRATRQPGDSRIVSTTRTLADCLVTLRRYPEAEDLLLECHATIPTLSDSPNPAARPIIEGLVELYTAWERPEQAADWRAKLPTTQPAE